MCVGSFRWAGLFAPCGGNNLESILLISPVVDYETVYLLLRVQECRFMRPCLSFSRCRAHSALHGGWDTDSLICPLDSQTPQIPNGCWGGAMTHVSASCWQWNKAGRVGVVILVSEVDPCSLQRSVIELDGGFMCRLRWVFLDYELEFYPLDLLRYECGESSYYARSK
jgi:hypothetical protein